MREINQTETVAVSGAGLSGLTGGVNNALTNASDLFGTTVASIGDTTGAALLSGKNFKTLELALDKETISAFFRFLSEAGTDFTSISRY
ncbi:hypothetical protein [Pantoea sp. C2G6]|uniref:hypothetical protein n=1 Tax=Pantoea sp. C2G6 TaxID=3243084 RepID=UPI003ED8F1ED